MDKTKLSDLRLRNPDKINEQKTRRRVETQCSSGPSGLTEGPYKHLLRRRGRRVSVLVYYQISNCVDGVLWHGRNLLLLTILPFLGRVRFRAMG